MMITRKSLRYLSSIKKPGGSPPGGSFTGVLDGISNVAAAYSLRRLSSSYEGDAVRVRRSSDSSEQDIGFDANGDFDTSAFSTFVGGGTGYVTTWYDQSGNSRDATQATTTKQPIVSNNVINGKSATLWSNETLFAAITLASPVTIITVIDGTNWGSNDSIYDGASTNSMRVYNTSGTLFLRAGTAATLFSNTAAWHVFTSLFFGSSSGGWVNGGTKTTVSSGTVNTSGFRIGTIGGDLGPSHNWLGDMAEIVLLASSVSATDHNTIGNDMADYYGLSWTTVT